MTQGEYLHQCDCVKHDVEFFISEMASGKNARDSIQSIINSALTALLSPENTLSRERERQMLLDAYGVAIEQIAMLKALGKN